MQGISSLLGTIPDFQIFKPASKWILHNFEIQMKFQHNLTL